MSFSEELWSDLEKRGYRVYTSNSVDTDCKIIRIHNDNKYFEFAIHIHAINTREELIDVMIRMLSAFDSEGKIPMIEVLKNEKHDCSRIVNN